MISITAIWSAVRSPLVRSLALGLVLAVLLGWLFWARGSLKADLAHEQAARQAVQTALDASQATLTRLRSDLATRELALAEREQAIITINAERDALRRRWQEAIRNDQAVADWGACPLPDAVRGLLR